jgi:hypothetical protein
MCRPHIPARSIARSGPSSYLPFVFSLTRETAHGRSQRSPSALIGRQIVARFAVAPRHSCSGREHRLQAAAGAASVPRASVRRGTWAHCFSARLHAAALLFIYRMNSWLFIEFPAHVAPSQTTVSHSYHNTLFHQGSTQTACHRSTSLSISLDYWFVPVVAATSGALHPATLRLLNDFARLKTDASEHHAVGNSLRSPSTSEQLCQRRGGCTGACPCTASGHQLHSSLGSTGQRLTPPPYSLDLMHGPVVWPGLWRVWCGHGTFFR